MKMAYEAAREQFLRTFSEVPVDKLPQDLPAHFYEPYRNGYEQGYRDATEVEPITACKPPAELEGRFARAWERGYVFGMSQGERHAQTLLAEIWQQFKSTLV